MEESLNWFVAFFVLFAIVVVALLVLIFMALRVIVERTYKMQDHSKEAMTIVSMGMAEIRKAIERIKLNGS
jgi:uncharacterized protein YpmS